MTFQNYIQGNRLDILIIFNVYIDCEIIFYLLVETTKKSQKKTRAMPESLSKRCHRLLFFFIFLTASAK